MRIEGPGLDGLRETIGAVGIGAQVTELTDGLAEQVLTINEFIRRGRTWAGQEGIFTARLVNTHAAADAQAQTINPYATTPANGWQNPIPVGYDVWLLSVTAVASVDALISTTIPSYVSLVYPATKFAFGQTQTAVTRLLRTFNVETPYSGGAIFCGAATSGTIPNADGWRGQPIRIPRGALIGWNSTSLQAGDLTALLTIGLFPAGMGQDAEL